MDQITPRSFGDCTRLLFNNGNNNNNWHLINRFGTVQNSIDLHSLQNYRSVRRATPSSLPCRRNTKEIYLIKNYRVV